MNQNRAILIAEDSEDDLILLKRAFHRAGVVNPIHVVRSGRETISYLKGNGKYADREAFPFPSVLLLDLNMPDGDGFEVLTWVRNKLDTSGLLVVVLTRMEEIKVISRAYALGANSFLTKPGNPEDLQELVNSFHGYWLLKNICPPTRNQTINE